MKTTNSRASVASLHRSGNVLVVPCVWDAPSTRIVTTAGAQLIATSSARRELVAGRRDGQHLTKDDVIWRATETTAATHVPVSIDIEQGILGGSGRSSGTRRRADPPRGRRNQLGGRRRTGGTLGGEAQGGRCGRRRPRRRHSL
jgi:hypothetical protein